MTPRSSLKDKQEVNVFTTREESEHVIVADEPTNVGLLDTHLISKSDITRFCSTHVRDA